MQHSTFKGLDPYRTVSSLCRRELFSCNNHSNLDMGQMQPSAALACFFVFVFIFVVFVLGLCVGFFVFVFVLQKSLPQPEQSF